MLSKKKLTQSQFIAYAGVLSAIAILLLFIEVPYPLVPWLKMDFSEVVVLLAAVINFWLAIIVLTVKAWLSLLIKPNADFIGHLAMFLGSITIVVPYYLCSKKLSKVQSLVIAVVVFAVAMTALNFFYITPAYLDSSFSEMVGQSQPLMFGTEKMRANGKFWLNINVPYITYIVAMYLPFNIMKGSIVSVIFYFLSNRLDKEQ